MYWWCTDVLVEYKHTVDLLIYHWASKTLQCSDVMVFDVLLAYWCTASLLLYCWYSDILFLNYCTVSVLRTVGALMYCNVQMLY